MNQGADARGPSSKTVGLDNQRPAKGITVPGDKVTGNDHSGKPLGKQEATDFRSGRRLVISACLYGRGTAS